MSLINTYKTYLKSECSNEAVDSVCEGYKDQGLCNDKDYEDYMDQYCLKACGNCDGR